AFDIGTGSGVIAAILAKRGIPDIIATDTNPKAIACAIANLERLGLDKAVNIQSIDLFPETCADLIVCNPPWLPAKPTSAI
ncbi:methyltransferase, partial [Neisseria sp. P0017.S005]